MILLEYNKRYQRRDGYVTQPLIRSSLKSFPFSDPRFDILYDQNGKVDSFHESAEDLVLEFAVEHEPFSEPKGLDKSSLISGTPFVIWG